MTVGLSAGIDVKTALIARLRAETGGGLLDKVSVDYAWNKNAGPRSIYGGGFRARQENAVAEQPGLLMRETVTVSLYVNVTVSPPTSVEDTDAQVKAIETAMGQIFANNPQLAGGYTWLGMAGSNGDYSNTTDKTTSIVAYEMAVEAFVTWKEPS